MIFLTQETGFLKPIAWLLGQIFNFLFLFVEIMCYFIYYHCQTYHDASYY